MVENDRRKDLANMYCLLKPLPGGLSVLADTLEHHMQNEGLDAVKSMKAETAHIDFVENMVVVQKKYKEIVSNVFNSDQLFLSALDKACTKVINWRGQPATPGQAKLPPCKSPELVSFRCVQSQILFLELLLSSRFLTVGQVLRYFIEKIHERIFRTGS